MKTPDVPPNPREAAVLDSIDALEGTIRNLEEERHRFYLLLAEMRARRGQALETMDWPDQLPDSAELVQNQGK